MSADPLVEVITEAIHGASKQCVLDLAECREEGSCAREARAVLAAITEAGYRVVAPGLYDEPSMKYAALMAAQMVVCRCGALADPRHCDHCHNNPPRGHACPRCGLATMATGVPA